MIYTSIVCKGCASTTTALTCSDQLCLEKEGRDQIKRLTMLVILSLYQPWIIYCLGSQEPKIAKVFRFVNQVVIYPEPGHFFLVTWGSWGWAKDLVGQRHPFDRLWRYPAPWTAASSTCRVEKWNRILGGLKIQQITNPWLVIPRPTSLTRLI